MIKIETFWRCCPLVDAHSGSLSITRCLVVYNTIMLWHVIERGHAITGIDLALHIALLSAAFGKSTFSFFLTKWSRNETVTTSISDATTRTITENRASGDHESTP